MGTIVKALGNVVGSLFGFGSSPKVDASAATGEVNNSQTQAQKARSLLLETAGQSAGSPLQPGQVSPGNGTVFGN